jgi:hypothetical protein
VAGLAGLLAVGASRRRVDLGFAALLALAAGLGGTPGWYGFLVGFWATLLARRTVAADTGDAPAAAVPARI